jgi:hypothetical protein
LSGRKKNYTSLAGRTPYPSEQIIFCCPRPDPNGSIQTVSDSEIDRPAEDALINSEAVNFADGVLVVTICYYLEMRLHLSHKHVDPNENYTLYSNRTYTWLRHGPQRMWGQEIARCWPVGGGPCVLLLGQIPSAVQGTCPGVDHFLLRDGGGTVQALIIPLP